jgi:NADH:ubiquinone reductase (H+-translocating)
MAARPQVVVVGAGFGGLNAAKRLEQEAVDVTVIDQHNYHQFQPLLYQVATAGLNAADVAYAVRGLFRRQKRVFFKKATVVGVDWDGRDVLLEHGHTVPFDYLVIAAGSSTNYFGIPGAEEFAFPLYGLEDAITLRNHLLGLFEAADAVPGLVDDGILNFVVVGGGPTGVEVAGALAELVTMVLEQDFHDLDVHRSRIILVEQAPELLGAFGPRSRRYARRELEAKGVEVRTGVAVRSLTAEQVELDTGEVLPTRCLVWAAGVRANPLADELGMPTGRGGRVRVEPDLSLPGQPNAFLIGDMADMATADGRPLPQLAQVAMQGGRHVSEQILRTIDRRPRVPFRYLDKGAMATIGRRAAVAELAGGVQLTGALAWLAWLGLHLLYLLGVRNRVSVVVNWAWNYVTWDRGPRLILRPEELPHAPHPLADAAFPRRLRSRSTSTPAPSASDG